MVTKLYVGNLSYTTGEADLQQLFAKAGPVKSVALITDRDTGRSKGFAFVEMETQADAQKAISMFNGLQIMGAPVGVQHGGCPALRPNRVGRRNIDEKRALLVPH